MKKLLIAFSLILSLFAGAQKEQIKKEVHTDSVMLAIAQEDGSYEVRQIEAVDLVVTYTKDSVWINNARHSAFLLDSVEHVFDEPTYWGLWWFAKDETGRQCAFALVKLRRSNLNCIVITYADYGVTYQLREPIRQL